MKGLFITFEGSEGSGKSTQITLLAESLKAGGSMVVLTREPGGTSIGDQVRKILLDPSNTALDPTTELLLYAASRAQHLAERIVPALKAGVVVLCDRFSDATIAYQGYGRGLDIGMIRAMDRTVTSGLRPHLTILFDIDAASGLARARGRNSTAGLAHEGRFEEEDIAFHERVRMGYLALAREEPDRIRVVDAARPPDDVRRDVKMIVDEALKTQRT